MTTYQNKCPCCFSIVSITTEADPADFYTVYCPSCYTVMDGFGWEER